MSPRVVTLSLVVLSGAGCFVPRDATARQDNQCVRCHGDAKREGDNVTRAAPPMDTWGNTAVSYPGVGAHAEHLTASKTHGVVACAECHKVPETAESAGHNDGTVQLVFGGIATKDGGLSPSWDYGARQCLNSGCHGPTSGKWTRPRTSDEACGSCHTLPPKAPHPQSTRCDVCHAEVYGADGIHAAAKHVDGVIQRNEASCDSCHGANDGGAPGRSLDGGTDVTNVGVGAHQAHLSGGRWSKPVDCTTCHEVPTLVATMKHPNGGAAEVLATVKYDATTRTCATSCHGVGDAGVPRSPEWNSADAGISCSSCHGAPPPLPHPQVTQQNLCVLCHPAQNGQLARGTHVNGVVNQNQPLLCNGCHGSPSSMTGAPPNDLSGSADTTRPGVGAHQSHLVGHGFARQVACAECHVVPAAVVAQGHINGVNDVRFQGVATSNFATAVYTASSATCTNGCHDVSHLIGAPGSGGGQKTTPKWTQVDGSQRQCDSCHGAPPPLPHVNRTDCGTCHLNSLPDGGFVRPELHVNGHVEFATP